jgi:hypothetical protein
LTSSDSRLRVTPILHGLSQTTAGRSWTLPRIPVGIGEASVRGADADAKSKGRIHGR